MLRDNNYSNNSRPGKMMMLANVPVLNPGIYNHPTIDRGRHKLLAKSPTVDSCSAHYNFIKLLQLNSPSSAMEHIDPMTPLKVNMEEETLVVDAIPVDSGSGGSSLLNSPNRRLMYRPEEDVISCLFGSKSRINRAKEEHRLSRFALKSSASEALTAATTRVEPPKLAATPTPRPVQVSKAPTAISSSNWSPIDDSVVASLTPDPGKTPSRKELESYINQFLYGPSTRRRLPVFDEIYRP